MEIFESTKRRPWWGVFVGALLLSLLTACASTDVPTVSVADLTKETEIAPDYQIGPEDVIEVLVWKNPDLSRVVNVRPDGKISLPLIGDVQAAGLTTSQLTEQITERLKEYYQQPPEVSVIVREVNSYSIYISGEISKPGRYVVKRGTTFLQAITLAGGFTPFASTSKVLLLRRNNEGKEIAVRLNYDEIVGGNLQNNIILKPGDTIVVP